jgi:hypothetical protein
MTATFANPWHDEIGRFAPKGTGTKGDIDDSGGMTRPGWLGLHAPKSAKTLTRVARILDSMPETREVADLVKGAAEAEDPDEFDAWMEDALNAIARAGGTSGEMLDIERQLDEIRRAGFTMPPVLTWGINEFANPWHDEEGKFAPKGAGTKSSGVAAPEGTDQPTQGNEGDIVSKLEVKPGGNRSTGVDHEALAQEVINGGDIVVNPIDADDVIRNFADAPQDVVDLTGVTVEGAPNMFSKMRESGRARTEMPQITPDVQPEWFDTLRQEGINFVANEVDPASLSATQSELNGKKVGGMIRAMEGGTMSLEGDALLVSSDGHILDGHHRWAAAAAMSADCGGCIKIPVIVIDLPITELVSYGLNWTDARGIPRAGVGTPSKKQAAGMSPWIFTMKGVTFAAKNFMEGGTPVPEGEYPKFATDAEDGLTDADFVGLPQGDGSLSAANANTAVAEKPAEGDAVTASGARRQFGLAEFMNPWHDEIGRFAPKGTGTQSGGSHPPVTSGDVTIEFDDKGEIVVSDEAMALAKPVYEEAQRRERAISDRLIEIVGDRSPEQYEEPPPPQLYGFEFRRKEQDKIAEKIEREVLEAHEEGIVMTREQAAAKIKDAVRYTVHYTQDEFGEKAQAVIDQLAQDNPGGKVKNTWPPGSNNVYKGVNVNVTTDDGYTYEIQFHTPESQAIKDAQHDLYKQARVLPKGDPRRVQLEAQMDQLSKGVEPPTGAIEVSTPERWRERLAASAARLRHFLTQRHILSQTRHWSVHE